MRLLITGGAGFVGSHACVSLLEAGHDLLVIDDFSNSTPDVLSAVMCVASRRLEWIEANICDGPAIEGIIARATFDAVLHFAALKSAPESLSQPNRYWDVNVMGMTTLLRAAVLAGIDKFMFSSSASIYGEQTQVPTPESSVPRPASPYAWTKLVGEQLLLGLSQVHPSFRACILRYFNPIGAHPCGRIGENPKQPPTTLFPVVLAAARHRTLVDVYGGDYDTPDGSAIRDFIHVMDVVDAHTTALDFLSKNAASGSGAWTFNVGTGTGCSVLQLIAEVEAACRGTIAKRIIARRPGDIAASVADPSLAVSQLGWRPRRSLGDACRDALRFQDNVFKP